jgi:hypothetical protein
VPKEAKRDGRFLIAYPSGFPGVAIPLVSDEECRLRGIEPGKFPPRETWTQEQRDAANQLAEILLPHVIQEVLQVMLAEMEREFASPDKPDIEVEREAALRGIRLVDSGKWKQHDTTIHFPPSWIRQVLELFAQGRLSLVDPPPTERTRKSRRRTKAESAARRSR